MKRIESFCVNHDVLEKGMYISRIDGDAVTYDIRMKKPNGGDYLSYAAAHTIEHLFATYARNAKNGDRVIYIGPMGCRTGFYFIVRDDITPEEALLMFKDSMRFICGFEGKIPGTNREECGNYIEHDLEGAKRIAKDMLEVLADWDESKMHYKE